MIIVTGGAGFIGSNIVKGLNARGIDDVVVVDDMTDGRKFRNIVDCRIADYLDKDDFLERIRDGQSFTTGVGAIIHQGACSTTTEWDGRFMLNNNFEYSKVLLHFCLANRIPFLYASSAATYGGSDEFVEEPINESPINVYGYSKLLFDQYVRRYLASAKSQVVGLRYFNVYGPREAHKGSMASVAYHLNNQLLETGTVRLFEGCDGYSDGGQLRDFIYVDDAVAINLHFLDNPQISGVFNAGTGACQPFNDVARAVVDWHGRGEIEYVPFPEHLRGSYQSYTQADLKALRSTGYESEFLNVSAGVSRYLDWLNS